MGYRYEHTRRVLGKKNQFFILTRFGYARDMSEIRHVPDWYEEKKKKKDKNLTPDHLLDIILKNIIFYFNTRLCELRKSIIS